MKLREIFKKQKHVTFCFGRFNPPNFGHSVVFETVKETANGNDWFVFTSKRHDKKSNPLDYSQKLKWLYTLHPELKEHIVEDPNIKTYLQAASYLYKNGYTSATFVAGTEEIDVMKTPLETYNGVKNQHGTYNFESLTFVTSPSPEGRSTEARNAAKSNNLTEFQKIVKIKDITLAEKLMRDVRQGMNVENDSFL